MAIGPLWLVSMLVASITAIATGALLYIYARNLTHVRSRFAVGLVIFALAVIIQNILAVYFYFLLSQSFPAVVAIPLIIVGSLELAGIGTLLWVTWRI